MITADEIKTRLEDQYEKVKVFAVGVNQDPVFFACNSNDRTFMLVSIYIDSEIGGLFNLEPQFDINYVYNNFDVVQAESLRNGMIIQIHDENVEVVGSVDPKKLH